MAAEANLKLQPRSLGWSAREALLPFSTDKALRDSYKGFFGDIRIGKILEDLDAFVRKGGKKS